MLLGSGPKLEAKEVDINDLSRYLVKMPNKHNKDNISAVITKLFEVAKNKMKDESDKELVDGLRTLVKQVESDLYQPKPRYLDAFFFPNEKNI